MKTPVLSAVLTVSLTWNALALAQPAHAPAHGARGHQQDHHSQDNYPRGSHHESHYRSDLPRFNEQDILRILRQYDVRADDSLPPGMRNRLAQGKPLPPGIAKRFDDRVYRELPQYPGYEWERVGADVVLIEAATRIVVDIITNALIR
ncbi:MULTISPECIES: anti-virulence regulator CigR family protein [unclassified Halomonas]|uniref:anti-virulence regulator CigR family protein n=1 Tax=unclassified Halomonas TaxID=2609666 RepID=UPI0020A0EF39|nr:MULTISPECIES: anti-virulence regulator CigR family protein [unclassified Halomonas]MCP1314962.1 RcnB family protein [Halomonas sp. 707D7]MCP1328294.1 RcnB family protein [Halomonas sp. 707D4]